MKSLNALLLWASVVAAFAAALLGVEAVSWLAFPPPTTARVLDVVDDRLTEVRGFAAAGISPGTQRPPVDNVRVYGSWIKSGAGAGEFVSPWYRAAPGVNIVVSGYPTRPGMFVQIETRHVTGETSVRRIVDFDPRQTWAIEPVYLAPSATMFRIRAVDADTSPHVWLGISEPFRFESIPQRARLAQPGVRELYGATLLAFLIGIACARVAWFRERVRDERFCPVERDGVVGLSARTGEGALD